jgi:crotonobetainyl-CoA:carnitine CoA-transferase CaiB-like acyl-CoA transferase
MLEGMKVVEMASIAAGPSAAAMLAEWGASVIKIEPLGGDRGRNTLKGLGVTDLEVNPEFDLHNRGKRSIALALGDDAAHEIVLALVREADVFVTNMLSDKLRARKLDFASLSAVNARLVHASISGYGSKGPDSQTNSIDHTAFWSRSGLAHLMTPKGAEPAPIRMAMGDRTTALALTSGILAAYIGAQRTGRGKAVEASLLRTAVFVAGTDMGLQLVRGRVGSAQPRHANVNPMHSFYPTKDGRWIAITGANAESLAAALGHRELAGDPRLADLASRRKHAAEIVDLLDSIFREHTLAEWRQRFGLQQPSFRWAPVQRPEDVAADPQAEAAGAFVDVPLKRGGSYRGVAMAPGFFDADGTPDGLPKMEGPTIGEHTDEILAELGFAPQRIAELRARKVAG